MNIFVVDSDPYVAARNLCDRHVVKMILESCQLLSTADQILDGAPKEDRYRPTHIHHPCLKCLQKRSNRIWLAHHLNGLLLEYTGRYGKIHNCSILLRKYWKDLLCETPDFSMTDFPMCMPDEFKTGSVIESYRNYYRFKQTNLKSFSYRIFEHRPVWLD